MNDSHHPDTGEEEHGEFQPGPHPDYSEEEVGSLHSISSEDASPQNSEHFHNELDEQDTEHSESLDKPADTSNSHEEAVHDPTHNETQPDTPELSEQQPKPNEYPSHHIPAQDQHTVPLDDPSRKERLSQNVDSKTIHHTLMDAHYEGPVKNLRMEGKKAKYHFSNGDYYEGDFLNGTFHGKGIIYFTNGAQLHGTWEHGEMKASRFFFADDLEWKGHDWEYCKEEYGDRRIWSETVTHSKANGKEIHELTDNLSALSIKNGIKPAVPGKNQVDHLKKDGIVQNIPPTTFDTGDGYYVPSENVVKDYDTHEVVREVTSEKEIDEIIQQYRANRTRVNA